MSDNGIELVLRYNASYLASELKKMWRDGKGVEDIIESFLISAYKKGVGDKADDITSVYVAPELGDDNSLKRFLDNYKDDISELPLGTRALNCLENDGTKTVSGLVKKRNKDLLQIPNFGKKTLLEIHEALSDHGLSLRER